MPLNRDKSYQETSTSILVSEMFLLKNWYINLKHDMMNKKDISYPLALSHRKAYVGQTVIAYFKLLVLAVIYLF